jgi:hypothetical protein
MIVKSARSEGLISMRFDATMCDEKALTGAGALPRCPSCAQVMRLVRRTPRFNGLPDVVIFECRACGVSRIEEAR